MTTATDRRAGAGRGVRCAWSVVVALLAALAVLVHHDPTPVSMPPHAMSPASGTGRTPVVMAPVSAAAGHGEGHPLASAVVELAKAAMGEDGACSGSAAQHCSAASLGTVKLLPPSAAETTGQPDVFRAAPVGRGMPGTAPRDPPDLSLLSRLLI